MLVLLFVADEVTRAGCAQKGLNIPDDIVPEEEGGHNFYIHSHSAESFHQQKYHCPRNQQRSPSYTKSHGIEPEGDMAWGV